MSTISTHVLDTARGCPAEGVPLRLERETASGWAELGRGVTNEDGRVAQLVDTIEPGAYRMSFDTRTYFAGLAIEGFYPVVRVEFTIRAADEHYHVPLLLSPFGYSTYRGS